MSRSKIDGRAGGVKLASILVASASLVLLVTSFSIDYFPLQADETVLAWAAKQVTHGRTPYVDFFAFWPPGVMYGVAGVFALAGDSLSIIRVLSVVWLTASSVLLFMILVRQGVARSWAAMAALPFPALVVPYWPVSSHHWFAIGFGLAALLPVASRQPGPRQFLLAGMLAAFAGLCLQTEGVLFVGLIAARLMVCQPRALRNCAIALSAGVLAPIVATAAALLAGGTFGAAFETVVVWPLLYYKRGQPFHDVAALTGGTSEAVWTQARILDYAVFAFTISLVALIAVLLVHTSVRRLRAGSASTVSVRTWIVVLASCGVAFVIFLSGRAGWRHFIFVAPALLVSALKLVEWQADAVGRRVVKAWIAAGTLLMVAKWSTIWATTPPSLARVLAVDDAFQSSSLPALVDELPGVRASQLTVLHLSHAGSSLYFYWAPEPPPVDWLLPPSFGYNSPEQYEAIARFAQEKRVPYIVVPESYLNAYLTQESPLRDVLASEYAPIGGNRWGITLRRTSVAIPEQRHSRARANP